MTNNQKVYIRVELPYACFGIEARNGRVINAAPIGHWMIGKTNQFVANWIKKKNGSWLIIQP